jgi:succinylglutamate desuccinylase
MAEPASGIATQAARALAAADVAPFADSFANAGFSVRVPARGILQLSWPGRLLRRARLLLSVGVHGDETAPIELLASVLDDLARTPHALALDLMIAVGNPAAIAQGKRYLDADLNRMFCASRGSVQAAAAEALRADELTRASATFFAAADADKWHLDLHTAIRPSHFPTFAVVPDATAGTRRQGLLGWLGSAGIEAAILNNRPAGTFSAYTAQTFGAAGATVELGQVGALGENDLGRFADMRDALDGFIRSGKSPAGERKPKIFSVAQEVLKHSDEFRMTCDRGTWNFTPMQPGALIAEDGETVYRVGETTEYIVFPNPDVRAGLRAGLMVVPVQG